MTSRALVTGGAGFIGSHLVRGLLGEGAKVRVLDDLYTGSFANIEDVASDVEFVEGDVRDPETVSRAVDGVDVVFHLAAQVSVPMSVTDPVHTYEVNVMGTMKLLDACVERGASRFVLSSSCAVYGDGAAQPKVEDMPPEPLSAYASSKLAGEHLCRVWARLHGVEAVALRYFNVFGPRQDPRSEYAAVIPRFTERILGGEPPVIFGDGRQTRDFVYVEDVVRANLAASRSSGAAGEVFNVGTGASIDLLGLVALIEEVTGLSARPVHEAERAGDIRHSSSDVQMARRMLGWQPSGDLRAGLKETVDWFAAGMREPS